MNEYQEHQSKAAKARWAKIPKKDRIKAMKKIRRKLSPSAPDSALDIPARG